MIARIALWYRLLLLNRLLSLELRLLAKRDFREEIEVAVRSAPTLNLPPVDRLLEL